MARPWLFYPFLHDQHWYVPSVSRGFHADPGDTQGRGSLSLIPVALIVIRDLSIEGKWTQADAAQLSKAFAIGPFASGQKAEIVGQSLTCKGVQILACINEPLPVLPPRSDPALA